MELQPRLITAIQSKDDIGKVALMRDLWYFVWRKQITVISSRKFISMKMQ